MKSANIADLETLVHDAKANVGLNINANIIKTTKDLGLTTIPNTAILLRPNTSIWLFWDPLGQFSYPQIGTHNVTHDSKNEFLQNLSSLISSWLTYRPHLTSQPLPTE